MIQPLYVMVRVLLVKSVITAKVNVTVYSTVVSARVKMRKIKLHVLLWRRDVKLIRLLPPMGAVPLWALAVIRKTHVEPP